MATVTREPLRGSSVSNLEDEQLLAQDGQCVEAPVADVWFGVGVGGFGFLWRAMRTTLAVVLPRVGWRVQARRGRRREQPGWLRVLIWRAWNYQENRFTFISFVCSCYLIADMDADHAPRVISRICRTSFVDYLHEH